MSTPTQKQMTRMLEMTSMIQIFANAGDWDSIEQLIRMTEPDIQALVLEQMRIMQEIIKNVLPRFESETAL